MLWAFTRCLQEDASSLLPNSSGCSFSTVQQQPAQLMQTCDRYLESHICQESHVSAFSDSLESNCLKQWVSARQHAGKQLPQAPSGLLLAKVTALNLVHHLHEACILGQGGSILPPCQLQQRQAVLRKGLQVRSSAQMHGGKLAARRHNIPA